MTAWGLLLLGCAAGYVLWLAGKILTDPQRLHGLDVAFLGGVLVFPVADYARSMLSEPTYDADAQDLFAQTTLATAALGGIVIQLLQRRAEYPLRARRRGPENDGSSGRRTRRMVLVLVVATIAKVGILNPLLPYDPGRSSYLAMLATLLMVPSALVGYSLIGTLPRRSRPVGLLLAAAAFVVGAVDQSRTPAAYCFLGVGLLMLRDHAGEPSGVSYRRLVYLVGIPLAFGGLVYLAALIKLTGGSISAGGEVSAELGKEVAALATRSSYTDVFENTCFIQATFGPTYEYRPGVGLFSVITGPIPRSWWQDKPRGLSYDLSLAKLGPALVEAGNSLSPGMVGELWMNGGWFGVLLGAPALAAFQSGLLRVLLLVGERYRIVLGPSLAALWVMTLLQSRGDFYTITVRGGQYVVGALICTGVVLGCSWSKRVRSRWPASQGTLTQRTAIETEQNS